MCAVNVGIHGNSTFLYERIGRDRRIISQDTISALTTFHLLHLILANTKAALVLNTLINQTLRSKPSSNIWKSTSTIEIKQTIDFPPDSNGEASPAEKSTSKPSNAGTCVRQNSEKYFFRFYWFFYHIIDLFYRKFYLWYNWSIIL